MSTHIPAERANEARRRLAATFGAYELVWLSREVYAPDSGLWHFDVLRQGNFGGWVQQRYQFDEAADVLYFLGEMTLDDEAFRKARAQAMRFPIKAL